MFENHCVLIVVKLENILLFWGVMIHQELLKTENIFNCSDDLDSNLKKDAVRDWFGGCLEIQGF